MEPDYIIQMDADLSHHPKYIPIFLKEIATCDLVSGSRFLNSNGRRPINVSILSLWANRYVKWLLGLKITDSLGGFKCFRRRVIEKIDLDKFISNGFIFQAERIYRALKKGFVVKEIPIIFYSRKFEKSKKSIRIILEALLKAAMLKVDSYHLCDYSNGQWFDYAHPLVLSEVEGPKANGPRANWDYD